MTDMNIQRLSTGSQRGFTLIEVMIAMLVLAVGLLGLAFLQGQGLQFNTNAYSRTQATLVAYDIIDRMRANRSSVEAGRYDVPTHTAAVNAITAYGACNGSTCKCGTNACDELELAKYDLGTWYEVQTALLPRSATNFSTISRVGNVVTVTVRWLDREILKTQTWVVEL